MPSHSLGIGRRRLLLTVWVAMVGAGSVQSARAEVLVSGQTESVLIEAREATVAEALAALRVSFNVEYSAGTAIDRIVTGTYSGSLSRVIGRLLKGYNYAIQSSADGIKVVVVAPVTSRPVSGAPPRALAPALNIGASVGQRATVQARQ